MEQPEQQCVRVAVSQITRKNHFVPEWYQKGFLIGKSKYWYHDMHPEVIKTGNTAYTKRSFYDAGPKSCFFELDLYTTMFGTAIDDEIERLLFGKIDVSGAKAVRAFVEGRNELIHPAFLDFFEYMNAQMLRTPKGLDWIKGRYGSLNQVQLMTEMQSLRSIHCTMWGECVREIVSAAKSELKFIVSDCPVTLYNPVAPPDSPLCRYPNDPKAEWLGTQTIFPLDAEHCLILTHVDYAKDPNATLLAKPRENARYGGQTLVRTDAFIRTRELTRSDVLAINYVLKSRARRYVAASDKSWLSPELEFRGDWKSIAETLLPKDELWKFGGEVYVGYKDGSSSYFDQYGRTSKAHKVLRKPRREFRSEPNEPCGCGSGRKFKHCCRGVPVDERPSWEVYSGRERNLMFIAAVSEIIGLNRGATWEDVQRTFEDKHVVEIHRAFASLWPSGTDPVEILPRPSKGRTRALYMGISDPRTVDAVVTSWLSYFDEIIMVHPFLHPSRLKPEFSPTESPRKHRLQTLKNTLLLLHLEPFVRLGVVHLIPNPADLNPDFGQSMLHQAQLRIADWQPSEDDVRRFEILQRDDLQRQLMCLPEDAIRSVLNRQCEGDKEKVDSTLAFLKEEQQADMLALLNPVPPGGQLAMSSALNLESGMFIAILTGSIPYGEYVSQLDQFNLHARRNGAAFDPKWARTCDMLAASSLPLELLSANSLKANAEGRFASLKSALRALFEAMSSHGRAEDEDRVLSHLNLALAKNLKEWSSYGSQPNGRGSISLFAPQGGYSRQEVQRLLVTYARTDVAHTLPFIALVRIEIDDPS